MKPGFSPILAIFSSADSPETLLLSQAVRARSSDALTKACNSDLVFSGPITAVRIEGSTLSVDHRMIDGAVGAKFLNEIASFLEEPINLLA